MSPRVAIIDYRLGNLFSVKLACEHVGLAAEITQDPERIRTADGIILPGVGAFGDAMDTLRELGLDLLLQEQARAGKPFMGICLGMQLLMEYSSEFGEHRGLGIVPGRCELLDQPREGDRMLKVPHIGWNSISPSHDAQRAGTPLEGVEPGERFYFVHSFVVLPDDPGVVLATTKYGHLEFCAALRYQSIFACQFHPERSGEVGLRMYANLLQSLSKPEDIS